MHMKKFTNCKAVCTFRGMCISYIVTAVLHLAETWLHHLLDQDGNEDILCYLDNSESFVLYYIHCELYTTEL